MEPEVPTDSLASGPTQAEIRNLDAFWEGLSEPSVSDRFLRLVDEELAIVGFQFPDGAQGSEPESVAEARVALYRSTVAEPRVSECGEFLSDLVSEGSRRVTSGSPGRWNRNFGALVAEAASPEGPLHWGFGIGGTSGSPRPFLIRKRVAGPLRYFFR